MYKVILKILYQEQESGEERLTINHFTPVKSFFRKVLYIKDLFKIQKVSIKEKDPYPWKELFILKSSF